MLAVSTSFAPSGLLKTVAGKRNERSWFHSEWRESSLLNGLLCQPRSASESSNSATRGFENSMFLRIEIAGSARKILFSRVPSVLAQLFHIGYFIGATAL